MQTERIREIIGRFDTAGTVADLRAVGNGWINDTYRVMTVSDETPDYILQRINHHVFKDVELLQRNIERVTSHIRRKLAAAGADDLDRRVLRIVPARDGRLYHFDGENYWRMTLFIAGSVTHETISAPLALLTGRAFGEFQAMLSDMEDGALGETIPDFHNIEFRIGGLRDAVARDEAGRLGKVRWMADELLGRSDEMCLAERLHREGRLPKRVTHCDTKVNNLLFDERDRPLCVIDLDTTMPGYVLSDFGDFIRTGANTGAEDDPELDRVGVDMEIFRSFSKGYLESAASFLTDVERETLTLRSADADLHADRAIPDGLSGRRPILQDQTPGPQLAAVEGSVPALAKHRRARAGHAGLHRRAITGPKRRRTKAGGSPSIRLSHARAVFRQTVRKNRTVSPEAEFHKRDRSLHPPDSRTGIVRSTDIVSGRNEKSFFFSEAAVSRLTIHRRFMRTVPQRPEDATSRHQKNR